MVQAKVRSMSFECKQRTVRRTKSMDNKSISVLWTANGSDKSKGLRKLIELLETADEIIQEKAQLRQLGLTEEEIAGYEEFYVENFHVERLWSVKHGNNV